NLDLPIHRRDSERDGGAHFDRNPIDVGVNGGCEPGEIRWHQIKLGIGEHDFNAWLPWHGNWLGQLFLKCTGDESLLDFNAQIYAFSLIHGHGRWGGGWFSGGRLDGGGAANQQNCQGCEPEQLL